MTALGQVAVAAAALRLSTIVDDASAAVAVVHYCVAKRLVENFSWKCVKLVSPDASPAPRPGIELVVPLVSALLETERSQLPLDERRCFFCQEQVLLDDEHLAYLYRAFGSNGNLLVLAHCCRKPACKEQTDAWVTAVRAKPDDARHRCSQCSASDDPDHGLKFLACGACSLVNYCSEACQRKHWPIHRHFCKTVAVSKRK